MSSPNIVNRNDLNVKQKSKLTERKNLFDKYGKLPFKEGFKKRKVPYEEVRLPLSEYDVYNSQGITSRSRSVAPGSKQKQIMKKMNETEIELDSAAEQIIENHMNSYMDDLMDNEKEEKYQRDAIDDQYDEVGGDVYNINNDLNYSANEMEVAAIINKLND